MCVLCARCCVLIIYCSLFSYDSFRTGWRLRPRWDMGAGGISRCDRRAAVPAVSAAAGGCVPVSVPPEGLQPQAEARGGGPLM